MGDDLGVNMAPSQPALVYEETSNQEMSAEEIVPPELHSDQHDNTD